MVTTRYLKPGRLPGLFLRLCALGLLLSAQPAQAVTEQSLYGGSGMGLMRTADLMMPGEFSYSLRGNIYEYLFPPATSTELDTTTYIGVSFAWGEYTEMGFSIPYQISHNSVGGAVPAIAGGPKPFTGYAKFSFTGYVKQGFGAAVTVYGSYVPPGTLVPWLASGQNQFGVEFNFSVWSPRTGFHFNIGAEKGDVRRASDATGSYTYSTGLLKAQLGMEMYMNDNFKLSFSMLGSVDVATLDENLMISTGFHYIASPKTTIVFGTTNGFPSNRSNPQHGYFVTLTYSPNGQKKREPDMQANLRKVQQQNQRIENKLSDLDKKLDEINKRLQEQPPAAAAGSQPQAGTDDGAVSPLDQQMGQGNGIRVIVLNASGEDGMGGKVADMLRAKGYDVVAVDRLEQVSEETWIHYNDGMSGAAVQMDALFKGEQHVVPRAINNADIIIIIGADQLQ